MTQLPTNMIIALFPLAQPTQGKSAVMPGVDQESTPFAEAFETLLTAGLGPLPATVPTDASGSLDLISDGESTPELHVDPAVADESEPDLTDGNVAAAVSGLTPATVAPPLHELPTGDQDAVAAAITSSENAEAPWTPASGDATINTDEAQVEVRTSIPSVTTTVEQEGVMVEGAKAAQQPILDRADAKSIEAQKVKPTAPTGTPVKTPEVSVEPRANVPTDESAKPQTVNVESATANVLDQQDDIPATPVRSATQSMPRETSATATTTDESILGAELKPLDSETAAQLEPVSQAHVKAANQPAKGVVQHANEMAYETESSSSPKITDTMIAATQTESLTPKKTEEADKRSAAKVSDDSLVSIPKSESLTTVTATDAGQSNQALTPETDQDLSIEVRGGRTGKSPHHNNDAAPGREVAQTAQSENAGTVETTKRAEQPPVDITVSKGTDASQMVRRTGSVSHHQAAPITEAAAPVPTSDARPFTIETPKPIQVPGQVRVRIDPPELGYIRVDLTSSANGIVGTMRVRSDQTRDMVERHLGDLHKSLAEAGVRVERLEIIGASRSDAKQAFNPSTPNQNQEHGHASQRQGQSQYTASGNNGHRRQDDAYRQPAFAQHSTPPDTGVSAYSGVNLFA